jgi:hypothetical protein
MKGDVTSVGSNGSTFVSNEVKKQENHRNHFSRDATLGVDLWTDGLICAFEFVRGHGKIQLAQDAIREVPKRQVPSNELNSRVSLKEDKFSKSSPQLKYGTGDTDILDDHSCGRDNHSGHFHKKKDFPRSYWMPIGWARITELTQKVQVYAGWASQLVDFTDNEDDVTVADVATPYWERAVGPTWWCHVAAGHPYINDWLSNAQWLHPAISIALRDESRLISERMKYLLYEVNHLFYIQCCCLVKLGKEKKNVNLILAFVLGVFMLLRGKKSSHFFFFFLEYNLRGQADLIDLSI